MNQGYVEPERGEQFDAGDDDHCHGDNSKVRRVQKAHQDQGTDEPEATNSQAQHDHPCHAARHSVSQVFQSKLAERSRISVSHAAGSRVVFLAKNASASPVREFDSIPRMRRIEWNRSSVNQPLSFCEL